MKPTNSDWIKIFARVVDDYTTLDTQEKFTLLVGLAAMIEKEVSKFSSDELDLFLEETTKVLTASNPFVN